MKSKHGVAIVLFILLLILTGCQNYHCTKISSADDIPERIRHQLSDIKLERGIYFFSSAFTGDKSAFIVVCGGNKYQDGYNVDTQG